jgi:putative chitinase
LKSSRIGRGDGAWFGNLRIIKVLDPWTDFAIDIAVSGRSNGGEEPVCIDKSVGENGVNSHNDVVIVQALLNFNRPVPLRPIEVDGSIGRGTKDAIREFQSRILKLPNPDGRVDVKGRTLEALGEGLPPFSPNSPALELMLRGIMPLANAAKISLYLPHLKSGMAKRSINSALRQAHFLAQLGHESMAFVYAEEVASGAAYEGRVDLGNTEPGDGKRFKGRGLIQLTGRNNYMAYGTDIGKNLTDGDNPTQVATIPALAVDVACWFWDTKDLNTLADADDIIGITQVVNGGLNGLHDRKAYLRRAKFFFKL